MKKLTFKVTSKKKINFASIVKEIDMLPCRIVLDLEHSIIIAKNVDETMIDTVKAFIRKYYMILKVDTEEMMFHSFNDDIVVEAVSDKYLEDDEVHNWFKVLYKNVTKAIYDNNVEPKKIGRHIFTCNEEIQMRYLNPTDKQAFSVGDVVECYMGYHLCGEVEGLYVRGIVCKILNDSKTGEKNIQVYIVPIFRNNELKSRTIISKLEINSSKDMEFGYNSGIALIDKGRYINSRRIKKVLGRTTPEFFSKLLSQLPDTFTFPRLPITSDEASDLLKETMKKCSNKSELALLEIVGDELEKLDKFIPVEEQIEDFLLKIHMPISDDLLTQSFVVACEIEEINYRTVISKLQERDPYLKTLKVSTIQTELKDTFKFWVTKYPIIAEKCSRISIMSLLKLFAKRFK